LVAKVFGLELGQLQGEITMESHGLVIFFNAKNVETYALLRGSDKSLNNSGGFAWQYSEIPELTGCITVGNNVSGENASQIIVHERRHQENLILFPPTSVERGHTPLIRAKDEIIAYMRDGRSKEQIQQSLTKKEGVYDYFTEQRLSATANLEKARESNHAVQIETYEAELKTVEKQWQRHCEQVNRLLDKAFEVGVENLDALSITPAERWRVLRVRETQGAKELESKSIEEAVVNPFIEKINRLQANFENFRKNVLSSTEARLGILYNQITIVRKALAEAKEYASKIFDVDLQTTIENSIRALVTLYNNILVEYRMLGSHENSPEDAHLEAKKAA
jgi:hypothetical protein